MKKIKTAPFISIFVLLFFYSNLSYSLVRYSNSGGSYIINLASSNSIINNTPIIGSNGEKYYSIAPPNKEGIVVNESTSQSIGMVECRTNYIIGSNQRGKSFTTTINKTKNI